MSTDLDLATQADDARQDRMAEETFAKMDRTLLIRTNALRALHYRAVKNDVRDLYEQICSEIRNDLLAAGKTSLRFKDVEIRFSSAREPYCTCHKTHVSECESARAGFDVTTQLVDCEPYLSIRPIASGAAR